MHVPNSSCPESGGVVGRTWARPGWLKGLRKGGREAGRVEEGAGPAI